MTEIDKKLNDFTGAILRQSELESEQILAEVEKKYQDTVAAAEEEIKEELQRRTRRRLGEIKAVESKRVSARMMENRRKLFTLRNDHSAQILAEVREMVEKYVSSPEYPETLKSLLQKGLGALGKGSVATVLLRKEDMVYAQALGEAANSSSLSFDEGDITLGGLIVTCPSKSVNIDMTFDSALLDLDGHIAEMFGLDIE
jgi:vacuolar-type H+-ATPase subunit E/Vma4